MRVLYVNHTAAVSGAERSLLTLLAALPEGVDAAVACPQGDFADTVGALAIAHLPITATAGSLRLHPTHTPVATAEMARAALGVGRAARAWHADIVHANSIRGGLETALAPVARARRVTSVRDCLPPVALSRATMKMVARSSLVVANSLYTGRTVSALAPRARVEVVHPAIDTAAFDPARFDRGATRARLGMPPDRALLGVVAQLTPWKGQDTAIAALGQLVRDGVDAQLLLIGAAKFIAGSTRFDNSAYVARLHEQVARERLSEHVLWLGERSDVGELVRALDVLLLPSHEEPFGRALLEAMALEVPVLATSVGGSRELVRDGEDGYVLDPHDARAWSRATAKILADPALGARMGASGRARIVESFGVAQHVEATLAIYERLLAGPE